MKRLTSSLAATALLAPTAAAQPIGGGVTVEAPTSIDPGAPGNQNPPPPRPPAPARPPVVIVGPDGKVIGGDQQPAAPGGYYVPGGPGGDLDPLATYDQPDTLHAGPIPELHVVRRGDTLWDISAFYFADPWQWPKVWSYNAQITNPHWIYPGDLVRLLPRGVFADATAPAPDVSEPERSPDAPPAPVPTRRIETQLRKIAFVERDDIEKSITIDGAVDEKLLLGDGDEVYLSYPKDRPPQVGKRYSIYIPNQPVRSKKGDHGSYVRLLGTLEVLSVKQDKRARGRIIQVTQEVERGAKVGPLLTTFTNVAPTPAKVDAQGAIVAMLKNDQLIGYGELVFLDLGKGSGVEVGNRMFVVRRGDAFPSQMSTEVGRDDRRFPARALGEIVIVDVGNKTSIGLVTLSVQEMSVGDLVMMQRAP